MAGKIQLTPEELLAQAGEMEALHKEYDRLFSRITSELNSTSGNWSVNLAHNFAGKLLSAQLGFSRITDMLDAGSKAAQISAKTFESVDSLLAKDTMVTEAQKYASQVNAAVRASVASVSHMSANVDAWGKTAEKKGSGKKKSFLRQVGGWIKDTCIGTADAVISGGKKIISAVKTEYNKHGLLYDVVEYGKCALKAGKGVVKIFGSVAAISTGVGVPLGILGLISAGNDIINASTDASYIYTDQYDQVGSRNYLKDLLLKNGRELGEVLFGNASLGEFLGKLTYTGMDMVFFLDGADKMLQSLGKVNTFFSGKTGYSFAWGKTTFDAVMDGKYSWTDWKDWIKKGLKIDPDSAANYVLGAVDKVRSVAKGAWKLGKELTGLV